MRHDVIGGMDRYVADEGNGFHRKGCAERVQSTELWIPQTGNIGDFEELPLGTEISDEVTVEDKDAALRRFGVEV